MFAVPLNLSLGPPLKVTPAPSILPRWSPNLSYRSFREKFHSLATKWDSTAPPLSTKAKPLLEHGYPHVPSELHSLPESFTGADGTTRYFLYMTLFRDLGLFLRLPCPSELSVLPRALMTLEVGRRGLKTFSSPLYLLCNPHVRPSRLPEMDQKQLRGILFIFTSPPPRTVPSTW